MRLEIDTTVRDRFPEVVAAAFRVDGLAAAAANLPSNEELMEGARGRLAAQDLTIETLVQDERIAGWREAFAAMGLKPRSFKSSAEALGRTLLKGDAIATPLPVVNAYCAVSAAHLAPLGAFDLARLPAALVEIRHARPGSDRFTPLAGKASDMPLRESIIVYAAGSEALTWGINHRDSATSCLWPETEEAIFVGEAVTAVQHAAIEL